MNTACAEESGEKNIERKEGEMGGGQSRGERRERREEKREIKNIEQQLWNSV